MYHPYVPTAAKLSTRYRKVTGKNNARITVIYLAPGILDKRTYPLIKKLKLCALRLNTLYAVYLFI